MLENDPDGKLTAGLAWARFESWPESEQAALRARLSRIDSRDAQRALENVDLMAEFSIR